MSSNPRLPDMSLPLWVIDAGYRQVTFRVPVLGELFYDRARDKVIESGRYDDVAETRPFVILVWEVRT